MFLIDDLLLGPVRGVVWACRQVDKAAREAAEGEEEAYTRELRELYCLLESDLISEQEFEAREGALLDRLERLEAGWASDDEEEAEADLGDEADG